MDSVVMRKKLQDFLNIEYLDGVIIYQKTTTNLLTFYAVQK